MHRRSKALAALAMALIGISLPACVPDGNAPGASYPEHCQTDPTGTGTVIQRGTRAQAFFDADASVAGVQLEAGHLGSPSTESFVGTAAPYTKYAGNATIQDISGTPRLLVEGVLQDDNAYAWDTLRPRITIERLDGTSTVFTDANATIDKYCFADVATGTSTRNGYFRAVLPITGVGEPGFEVVVDVQGRDTLGLDHVLGGDTSLVKMGPPPADAGDVVSTALGLTLDDDIIVDRDNVTNDLESVINERLIPQVRSKLTKLGETCGTCNNGLLIRLKKNQTLTPPPPDQDAAFIRFDTISPGPIDVDLDFEPTRTSFVTTTPPPIDININILGIGVTLFTYQPAPVTQPNPSSGLDDEARFTARLTIPRFTARGRFVYAPVSGDFQITGSANVELSVALNATPTGGLAVDLDIVDVGFNLLSGQDGTNIETDQWAYNGIVGGVTNFLVNAINAIGGDGVWNTLDTAFNLSPKLSDAINTNVIDPAMLNVQQLLSNGVTLPNGSGFTLPTFGLTPSCARLGCNGAGAGSILMSQQGIEVALKAAAQDRLPANADRKFPKVYAPSSPVTVTNLMASRTMYQTPLDYRIGLFANGAFLNQLVRAVVEPSPTTGRGLLDVDLTLGNLAVKVRTENAPMFVAGPFPGPLGIFPVSLWVPNLQVEVVGLGRYSVDLLVGVSASLDPQTQKLRVGFSATYDVDTLSCTIDLSLICLLPQVVLDYLKGPLTELLTDRTVGEFSLPQGKDLNVTDFRLVRAGAHLAAYVNVGVTPPPPTATVAGGAMVLSGNNLVAATGSETASHPDAWRFTATSGQFPGTTPYTYEWKVYDNLDPVGSAPVYTQTVTTSSPTSTITVNQTNNLSPVRGVTLHNGHMRDYSARAEVTITRSDGTVVRTATGIRNATFFFEDGDCLTSGC